jgi:hypothetical protein
VAENSDSNYKHPNLEKRINNRNGRPTRTENQANDRKILVARAFENDAADQYQQIVSQKPNGQAKQQCRGG